jgi:hypothetical protein
MSEGEEYTLISELYSCEECEQDVLHGVKVPVTSRKTMILCDGCATKLGKDGDGGERIDERVHRVRVSDIERMSYSSASRLQGGIYMYMYHLHIAFKTGAFGRVVHLVDDIMPLIYVTGSRVIPYESFAMEQYARYMKKEGKFPAVGDEIKLASNFIVVVDEIRVPKKKRLDRGIRGRR